MAFTINNQGSGSIADNNQSEVDSVDLDILVAGYYGTGVISGCAVTAQGTPDMTVAVAVGVIVVNDGSPVRAAVGSGNVTVTTADGSNPRFDLVVCNAGGTKSVVAGTAAANPIFPAIPANSVVLAALWVPANDTTIEADQIVDKRVLLGISIANLANGTDGEMITWDASGVPAAIAVGTSGHVLTSNGSGAAPTFQKPQTRALSFFIA